MVAENETTNKNSAQNYPSHHWAEPHDIEKYKNLTLNCLLVRLTTGYRAISFDAKGIYGRGSTEDEALTDFRTAVKERVESGDGGIYLQTSEYDSQEAEFADLIEKYKISNLFVSKERVKVTVFTA